MERLEDTQSFKTHFDKIKVYGDNLLEELRREDPGRIFKKRVSYADIGVDYIVSGSYHIKGKVEVPRTKLGRFVFGSETKRVTRTLVRLYRDDAQFSAVVEDSNLREAMARILPRLDERSGEKYSPNLRFSS